MITCAHIFTDHMLLQRNKPIAIFGSGLPGEKVVVTVPERQLSVSSVVDDTGKWRVMLPKTEAGTGCTLTVNEQVFQDVAFGEVWLAGGQSNMEFMLKDAKGGQTELAQCADVPVRCFQVPRNTFVDETYEKEFAAAAWQCASPENCSTWSAVAYLAAKELAEKLGVPVGIVGCNFGGSSVSCWISETDLAHTPEGQAYLEDYQKATAGKTAEEMIAAYDAYVAYHAAWTARMEKCYQEDGNTPWEEIIRRCGENQYPGPMGVKSPFRPAGMYHTMLKQVAPYTLAGAFYYQGENDDHRPDGYGTLLTTMIARWRKEFLDDSLPVMLVQLPMFAYVDTPENGAWSKLREAQMRVYRTVKHTGIAVALDCGEFGNIHPTDKHQVAHRLALQARYHVYGEMDLDAFAPVFDSCTLTEDSAVVTFAHAENGLEWHGAPEGFQVAGRDGVYYDAEAVIAGNQVMLTCSQVFQPVTVRYLWLNYAEVHLYGKNGLPAVPFRTDTLSMPLIGE